LLKERRRRDRERVKARNAIRRTEPDFRDRIKAAGGLFAKVIVW